MVVDLVTRPGVYSSLEGASGSLKASVFLLGSGLCTHGEESIGEDDGQAGLLLGRNRKKKATGMSYRCFCSSGALAVSIMKYLDYHRGTFIACMRPG